MKRREGEGKKRGGGERKAWCAPSYNSSPGQGIPLCKSSFTQPAQTVHRRNTELCFSIVSPTFARGFRYALAKLPRHRTNPPILLHTTIRMFDLGPPAPFPKRKQDMPQTQANHDSQAHPPLTKSLALRERGLSSTRDLNLSDVHLFILSSLSLHPRNAYISSSPRVSLSTHSAWRFEVCSFLAAPSEKFKNREGSIPAKQKTLNHHRVQELWKK